MKGAVTPDHEMKSDDDGTRLAASLSSCPRSSSLASLTHPSFLSSYRPSVRIPRRPRSAPPHYPPLPTGFALPFTPPSFSLRSRTAGGGPGSWSLPTVVPLTGACGGRSERSVGPSSRGIAPEPGHERRFVLRSSSLPPLFFQPSRLLPSLLVSFHSSHSAGVSRARRERRREADKRRRRRDRRLTQRKFNRCNLLTSISAPFVLSLGRFVPLTVHFTSLRSFT